MDSPMQVNEFNHIVDRSVLAVQMYEHTAARKLPNSKWMFNIFLSQHLTLESLSSREPDVEQRLLATIDQHIPNIGTLNSKKAPYFTCFAWVLIISCWTHRRQQRWRGGSENWMVQRRRRLENDHKQVRMKIKLRFQLKRIFIWYFYAYLMYI